MLVTAGLLVAGAGFLALIARELHEAPEGYEDDHGFHTVHKSTGAYVVPVSRTNWEWKNDRDHP